MTPARRLTVALLGLIALVVVGYFVPGLTGSDDTPPSATTSGVTSGAAAGAVPGASSGLPVEELSDLPAQARTTWELVEKGGPFPYPRNDGVEFRNREERLPRKSRDYYREYTVPTPGSDDRGARRLVTGSADEVYYTGDHYASFVVVDVTR
ncbi:ribonuclease domain-containing protein [Saccharothrix longispora]|uniref:Guanyl-specific ribonuclease Sa n=1 Tax=Saccharothrix longispora TaxID=33920 RepID=A0ABU1Q719_9PSEU|nr:ribonuclease domain-containing protein [Saccharothrix longispora]MDR6598702.1 guanyl-specific ribonuclease Sa [Saccharothrix longispora]